MVNCQTEPRAAHVEQRKRTHTKTRPKGQKQKKSTSLPKPCPNPFRTNRFDAPETWRSPANKTARVTESRATPRCGTEDKSTFVLIQVFLCAPGISAKNGPGESLGRIGMDPRTGHRQHRSEDEYIFRSRPRTGKRSDGGVVRPAGRAACVRTHADGD